MNNIFVTSDQHFYHRNILTYQPESRPFSSIEEMNEVLIERHNEVVGPSDVVYMLGDFAFTGPRNVEEILKRLNGRKHYIFGNHDGSMKNRHVAQYFESMQYYKEIKDEAGNSFVLFHYPIFSWNRMHHGVYHLYGHTHGQVPHLYNGRAMDVGVDTNNCYPWNLADIVEMFRKIEQESDVEGFHYDARGRNVKR